MIRRPPRSTPLYSSAASDVYKRQVWMMTGIQLVMLYVKSKKCSQNNLNRPYNHDTLYVIHKDRVTLFTRSRPAPPLRLPYASPVLLLSLIHISEPTRPY
eukprot:TRINITY_DN3753_c0_g1_i26.p1 TRINITY_DN3753_c0_g1~~TRINITY_DN3753_c0_g1_i26.p1  ORF type:complete len:108 (+),score=18.18 TRINITY_DN3753_c0_g1_i26:25-324(+)